MDRIINKYGLLVLALAAGNAIAGTAVNKRMLWSDKPVALTEKQAESVRYTTVTYTFLCQFCNQHYQWRGKKKKNKGGNKKEARVCAMNEMQKNYFFHN